MREGICESCFWHEKDGSCSNSLGLFTSSNHTCKDWHSKSDWKDLLKDKSYELHEDYPM